jgi:hypothetical protein
MRRMLQCLLFLSAAGLLASVAGCGGRTVRLPETGAALEGTVTYGGEKVLVALVIAQGEGGAATGFIGEDGRYKLDNVPLGEVTLAVNVDAGKGQLMSKIMAKQNVPKVVNVPAKYADPATSGIKTTIVKGPNTYDIVISK